MTSDRVKEGEDLQSSNNTVIPKKTTTLNPNAKVFQSPKLSSNSVTTTPDSTDSSNPDWSGQSDHDSRNSAASSPQVAMTTQGGVYQMNGDVGKYPSQSGGGGNVGYPPTPESPVFPLHNGYIPGTEFPYLPDGQIVTAEDLSQQEPPKGDDLRKLLQRQLEYYFSRENLANDRYLQSQMDSDQYVPIGTIANFNAVKKLTKDMQLIVDVLRESPFVQVDSKGEKVRPNHKRCTVILREVPDATPIEDVKALFTGEKCPKFVSCEFAHNSNWYITFESDVDAQNAYRFLREEVGTFQGKPIMARIKAKPLQRISFSPKLVNVNGYTTAGNQAMYQQQQFQFPPAAQQPINGLNSVPTSMSAAPQPQPPQQPQPAPQPQYAFYPNVAVAPQQWPTSPTAFYEQTMQQQQPFTTGAFPPQSKFQPINTARQTNYQGGNVPPRQSRPTKPRTASTPELRSVDRSSMQENSMQRHQSQNDRRTTPQMNGHLHPSPRYNNYESLTTTVERREERTEPPPPPPPPLRDSNKVELPTGVYRGRRNPPVSRYEETSRQESSLQMAPRERRPPRSSTYSSRRRREEDMPSSRRNSRDSREVRDLPREKEVPKPPSPPIDLASFPPLPGRPVELVNGEEEKETNNNEMIMPMADIVKGVKDPKRIAKVQEAAAAKASAAATSVASKQQPASPATKDSSTNTSDKEQTTNSSSNALPSSTSTSNSSKHTQIQVATQTDLDDSSSKSEVTKPHHMPKNSKASHTMCNTAVNTSVSMATSSGVTASIATTTTSVSTSSTAVSSSDTATTTHNSASTNSSAKTAEQPRLSYAAMLAKKAAVPKPNPQPEPATTQSSKTPTTQSSKTQSSSPQPTSKPQRQSSRSYRGDRDRDSYGETNSRFPLRREHYGGRRSPPHQKPSSK